MNLEEPGEAGPALMENGMDNLEGMDKNAKEIVNESTVDADSVKNILQLLRSQATTIIQYAGGDFEDSMS